MRESISEAPANPGSRILLAVYIVLFLALLSVSFDFVVGVLTGSSSSVLGLNLAAGFAIVALMVLVYYRMFVPHRFMIEHDEDIW